MTIDKNRVALVMPVANELNCAKNLPLWVERGYEVVVLQDRFRFKCPEGVRVVTPFGNEYRGWYVCCNELARTWVNRDVGLVVAAGDDMQPDPKHTAQEIAAMFWQRFPGGYGVMQPIGDTLDGTDRICGSPWFGRGWIERSYQGQGPMHGGYYGFYGDEELLNVAKNQGVLWQHPGLTQYHDHWTRKRIARPHYMDKAQGALDRDKALFFARKQAGFPGSEPLPE